MALVRPHIPLKRPSMPLHRRAAITPAPAAPAAAAAAAAAAAFATRPCLLPTNQQSSTIINDYQRSSTIINNYPRFPAILHDYLPCAQPPAPTEDSSIQNGWQMRFAPFRFSDAISIMFVCVSVCECVCVCVWLAGHQGVLADDNSVQHYSTSTSIQTVAHSKLGRWQSINCCPDIQNFLADECHHFDLIELTSSIGHLNIRLQVQPTRLPLLELIFG